MNEFLYGLTGLIVTPFEPMYHNARQDYNRAIQQYPIIIVYCRNKCDVSNAVLWSRKHQVPLRIRSGGHNYEGYSNGDYVLVIDVSMMNNIAISEEKKQVYVEGGVNNRQIYSYLSQEGYPFPGGTCPDVGLSGYTLGGGWGLSCRLFGLGCDNLEEIELVNYEGEMIKADHFHNSDLFWACRGAGGGNYGVIVSMTFRLPPKVEMVTLIDIAYRHVSPKEQEKFLKTWQEWLQTADRRITLQSRIYNSDQDGLAMLTRGIFYGDPDEAKQEVEEFLALEGAEYSIEYVSFLEAVTIIGSIYPSSEKFYSVSRFVINDFDEDEISQIVGLIRKRPQGSVFAGISLYALGGQVAETDVEDTAFYYRNAHYIIWLNTVWRDNSFKRENKEWISRQYPTLAEITTGSYVNFPYNKLPDYPEMYYGRHIHTLRKIKQKYDPEDVFTFPQGIEE